MSGLEIVGAIAGIISAFNGSINLYRSWRDLKAERLANAENRTLELSLTNGSTSVQHEYDTYYSRLGRRFAVGDDRARADLAGYVIEMQHTIIGMLVQGSPVSTAIVMPNLPTIVRCSENTRSGVLRVLAEQYQRMAQAGKIRSLFTHKSENGSSSSTSARYPPLPPPPTQSVEGTGIWDRNKEFEPCNCRPGKNLIFNEDCSSWGCSEFRKKNGALLKFGRSDFIQHENSMSPVWMLDIAFLNREYTSVSTKIRKLVPGSKTSLRFCGCTSKNFHHEEPNLWPWKSFEELSEHLSQMHFSEKELHDIGSAVVQPCSCGDSIRLYSNSGITRAVDHLKNCPARIKLKG